ncbi:MAG: sulfite exporter TauE/SafE family protein [candidate division Zixibacteria bacterium]|nr:sulfite exporter TauE/SafE family protein [candidate division Zixibacteria bacterium]MDH3937418.1 sulfite exporter TauE/SafE family protein [candidate division Zixibacteria bacterium]MDH4034958.1 sulfite exporter TauE/SafE family protein [candidate division Zixibacteria bacterium]
MDWYLYIAVIAAGFIAGFINTLAGSGSLVTLPLLIFLGLPANIANGTNRIAILLQNAVAVKSFHRQKLIDFRHTLTLAIPAVLGALVGAQIAVNLDEVIMRRTIGALMLVMLIVTLMHPQRWLEQTKSIATRPGWWQMVLFFGIGIYGGFIQAGVGIFLLAGLVLSIGYDVVHANGAKVVIVFCFTVIALAVFVFNDQVNWTVGLVLAIGNMSGAWVAARMAVKRGAVFVRWLLIVVLILSAGYLLGAGDVIGL